MSTERVGGSSMKGEGESNLEAKELIGDRACGEVDNGESRLVGIE